MTTCNADKDTYFDKVLQSALSHDRREKRREMVYILGELRDPRALDALVTIMAEDDPFLVFEAVRATGKIGGPAALEQLQIMMHHPSFIVRGEVALALDEMDHPKRDEILNQLLNDISPYVANCAYVILYNKRCNKGMR
jgi:HEAT repeat protein